MSKKNLSDIEKEIEDLETEEKRIRVRQEQIATSLYELKKKKRKLTASFEISVGDIFMYESGKNQLDIFNVLKEQSKGIYSGKYLSLYTSPNQVSICVSEGFSNAEKLMEDKSYKKITQSEFEKLFQSISNSALEKFKSSCTEEDDN